MSVMEMLRGGSSSTNGGPGRQALHRAALAGAGAAAISACVFVLPALLVWVASAQSTVSWTSALGVGAGLWLLGTGAHLAVGSAVVTVVPLLFLALAVAGGARAAVRAAHDVARDRTVVLVADLVHRKLAAVLGAWAAGYAACAALWAVVAYAAGPAPVLWTLLVPVVLVPAAAAACAVAWLARGRPELLGPRARRPAWLPEPCRRGIRPGLEGAGALLALGLLLCVALIVVEFDRVSHLQTELAPGLIGGTVLALAQVLALPNLAMWAVSFLAGTGFSAVEGASATWTGNRTSLLPMVPVFGALPEPGAFPGLLPVLVLLPVAVGAFVGWRSLRAVARLSTTRTKLMVTMVAVSVGAGSLGLLDAVGGASLGRERLAHIGAPAGAMTLALFVELTVGAGLVLAWDRFKLRR